MYSKGIRVLFLSIAITIVNGKMLCQSREPNTLHELYFQRVNFKDTNDADVCENRNVVYEDRNNFTHVCFQAFSEQFHLILSKPYEPRLLKAKNPPILRSLDEILTLRALVDIKSKWKILQGEVDGYNNSYVLGYVEKNLFCGYVETENDSYYIETKTSNNYTEINESNAIVYRYDDLITDLCFRADNTSKCHLTTQVDNFANTDAMVGSVFMTETTSKVRQPRSVGPNHNVKSNFDYNRRDSGISCKVNVMADHTYYNSHQKSRADVEMEIVQILSSISEIFKKLDFNGNYKADGFDIKLQSLKIYPERNLQGYPLSDDNLQPMDILKTLSSASEENSCLYIAFVSRDFFPKRCLGMGFLGNSNPKAPDGGICAPYEYYPGFGKGRFNTIFVTNRHGHITLPRSVVQMVLFHLIGHAFGSRHDKSDTKCTANKLLPASVMSELSTGSNLPSSMTFSTCSLMRMGPLIRNKGWCLSEFYARKYIKIKGPCGNGKVDPGEECDCGTVDTCAYVDKCCVPAGKPDQCKIDKSKGYKCSLLTKCCNQMCQIAKKYQEVVCDPWTECRDQTWCDGTDKCPPLTNLKKKNGYPCMGSTKTCNGGVCNSTVCRDINTGDCDCVKSKERCRVCCLSGTQCVPVGDSNPNLPINVESFLFKAAGSSCMNGLGICDTFGECHLQSKDCYFVDNILGLDRRGDSPIFWANYGFSILMVVILVLLAIVGLWGLSIFASSYLAVLGNFKKAVLVSKAKFLGVPSMKDNNMMLNNANRLSAMFPYATPAEITEVTTATDTEVDAINSLLLNGHAMRTNYKTVQPPTLDLPIQ